MTSAAASTKAGRVRQAVLDDILSGALAPGTPLDEVALARQHDVSRTPVREALRALQADGLLEVGPRRQLLVVDVSPEHRSEVTALRVALEGAASAAACERRDDDDLDRLELLLLKQGRAAAAGDAETYLRLDEEFHLALAGAARMPTLSRMLEQLGAFVRLARLGEATTVAHMHGLTIEHTELVDHLRSRRPARLRTALTAHIGRTEPRG
ncbi:GntR family transcriptional regulator [Knoellia sp. LjRoot47]|uniref:GntR family transcriptional regulator n=1 Tax=Knoellia sp. LjRoot47 TaxID=3342330 RepID=UPI003ECDD4B1